MRMRRKRRQFLARWDDWYELLRTGSSLVHVVAVDAIEDRLLGYRPVVELRWYVPEQVSWLRPWPKMQVRIDGSERWWNPDELLVRSR